MVSVLPGVEVCRKAATSGPQTARPAQKGSAPGYRQTPNYKNFIGSEFGDGLIIKKLTSQKIRHATGENYVPLKIALL